MNSSIKLFRIIAYSLIGLYCALLSVFIILTVMQQPLFVTNSNSTSHPTMVKETEISFRKPLNGQQSTATAQSGNIVPSLTPTTVVIPSPTVGQTTQEGKSSSQLNEEILGEQMLTLVNEARSQAGLNAVEWDSFAAEVAQKHAQDMARNKFFSHWNMSGFGPDHRYVQAGGSELAMENISTYWYGYEDGSPAEIEDFDAVVRNAQDGLMNSPGHRRNILDPDHTHVGVGFAYNADTGTFMLAQIFLNRYIRLNPLPEVASPGDLIEISGELLMASTSPLLNIAFEPSPQPMSVVELNQTTSYESASQFLDAYQPAMLDDNNFTFNVKLGNKPGLYHVRIWVNHQSRQIHSVNWIIEVK
jgi:uncharacterized protein YkwD